MNFNFSLYGACSVGLLVGLIIPIISNYVSELLMCGSLNNEAVQMKYISDAERLTSSLWCNNRLDGTKLCRFKNLYHIPDFKEHFLFLMTEFSVVSGIEDLKQLSLSTVQNHSGVNLKLIIIKSHEYLLGKNISFLGTDFFMIKSFKSDNIMHVIHDDILPLFVTYKELCSGDILHCISSYRLVLIDSSDYRPNFEWYKHFSVREPLLISSEKYPLCLKRGFFGLSNSSIWYQYGFKNVQGPVVNSFINSCWLMEFTGFIRQRFGLSAEDVPSTNMGSIVFFSRKVNRKILNEGFMEAKMKDIAQNVYKKNISIINLDLSTNDSYSIIKALQNTHLLVGIHGSAMTLAIFLAPGSHVIELFPFGIQPEVVSPLRALCKLLNVYYQYESWVNTNETNSRAHPEYPPLLGGLFHLEKTKQNIIINTKYVPPVKCCHDPSYLYRMFQDTIVDDSFFTLFRKVVSNYTGSVMTKQKLMKQNLELAMNKWYFPPSVFNLSCKLSDMKLKVTWDYPFEALGVVFSVATSNGVLTTTKQTIFSLNLEECDDAVCVSFNQSVSVWVKAVDGNKDSLDSFALCDNSR